MLTKKQGLQNFRRAVCDWLVTERASAEVAMGLQVSLLAGVIDGNIYAGARVGQIDELDLAASTSLGVTTGDEDCPDASSAASALDCGCLLHTLEQLTPRRQSTSRPQIAGATGLTFIGATRIGYGDTPSTNRWAAAAYHGITDYLGRLP